MGAELRGFGLKVGEYFEDRPLIYPILLSSLLFGILLIAFHIIEHVIVGLWHGQTMVESIPSVGGGGLTGVIVLGTRLIKARWVKISTNHGFHNDATPRYDKTVAKEAWQRTLDWFNT